MGDEEGGRQCDVRARRRGCADGGNKRARAEGRSPPSDTPTAPDANTFDIMHVLSGALRNGVDRVSFIGPRPCEPL